MAFFINSQRPPAGPEQLSEEIAAIPLVEERLRLPSGSSKRARASPRHRRRREELITSTVADDVQIERVPRTSY